MATMEQQMGRRLDSEDDDEGAEATVRSFFQAFNRRDLEGMAACIAEDMEHCNLAYTQSFKGKDNVVAFYAKFMRSMPEDATFHIDDTTGGSETRSGDSKIGVIWQLRVAGVQLPNSRGVSFFTVDAAHKIKYVRESPEHFVKMTSMALPTLSAVSPLIHAAKPWLDAHPDQSPAEPLKLIKNVSNTAGRSLVSMLPREWVRDAAPAPAPNRATAAPPTDGPAMHSVQELRQRRAESSSSDENADTLQMARTAAGGEVAMRPLAGAAQASPSGVTPATDSDSEEEARPVARRSNEFAGMHAGLWQKVKARSDVEGYGRALDLMGVGGIQKSTAMLIEGMEVRHTEDTYEVFYLTIVPYFKVRESYRFDVEVSQSRRDLRRGQQTAVAQQAGERVVVDVSWGSPQPGEAHEEYWLGECGCLHVESTVTVNGESETTLQVYERNSEDGMDSRYFAKAQKIPFGVDPNKLPSNMRPW